MKFESNPQQLLLPKWKWSFNKIISIISLLSFGLGLIVFIFPGIAEKSFQKLRIYIGIVLTIPIILLTILWLSKLIRIIYQRIIYYPYLFNISKKYNDELIQMKKDISAFTLNNFKKNIFELKGAKYLNNSLFIAIKKQATPKLFEGNTIIVIDRNDMVFIGKFEIIEVRKSEYYAKATKNIDTILLSYVRQKGETSIVPYLVAIHIPEGEYK